MKRTSWIVFWALSSSACGLVIDLPQLEQLSSGDGSSSLGGSAGAPSGGVDGACADCNTGGTGAVGLAGGGGAGGVETASGGSAGGGTCKTVCDCDGDTYLSQEGDCAGDDCDDTDPLVHPGQTKYFGVRAQNEAIGFDYDCSNGVERDPAQGGDTVLNCGLLGLANCATVAQAFEDTLPACGKPGAWGGCAKVPPLNATCGAQVLDDSAIARCH